MTQHDEQEAGSAPEPETRDPRLSRLDDLEAEAQALNKETGRLLVQRRKIQARIKSLFKQILRQTPQLAETHGEIIELEINAMDENALHFEVWFPEFRQIGDVLVEEARDALTHLNAQSPEAEKAAGERDRLRGLVDTLEAGRTLMADRLSTQTQEVEAFLKIRAELEGRVETLQAALREARAQLEAAPKSRGKGEATAEVEARLADAEARYEELGRIHEKDRLANAREVGSMTKQLTQLREKYEGQLAQLAAQNERLTEALVDKERGIPTKATDLTAPHGSDPPPPGAEGGNGQEPRTLEQKLGVIDEGSADGSGNGEQAASQAGLELVARDQLVILDTGKGGESAAAELSTRGYPIRAFEPNPELASVLPVPSIACAAVNVAVPHTWTTVRKITEMPGPGPDWLAYASANPAAPAYWFGDVSFLRLPVDNQVLTKVLRAPRLTPQAGTGNQPRRGGWGFGLSAAQSCAGYVCSGARSCADTGRHQVDLPSYRAGASGLESGRCIPRRRRPAQCQYVLENSHRFLVGW